MAKKAKKKVVKKRGVEAKVKKVAAPAILTLADYYASELKGIDKSLRLTTGQGEYCDPISTGLLCADFVHSGGVYPVFNQVSGVEQSGKSSISMSVMANSVISNVPAILYQDAEGCLIGTDKVLTPEGYISFNDLVSAYGLNSTIAVVTPDGKAVPALLMSPGKRPITRVTTENDRSISGFKHPVLVLQEDGSGLWKYIEDLKPGDVVLEEV